MRENVTRNHAPLHDSRNVRSRVELLRYSTLIIMSINVYSFVSELLQTILHDLQYGLPPHKDWVSTS